MARQDQLNPLDKRRFSEEDMVNPQLLLQAIYQEKWDKIQYFKEEAFTKEIIERYAETLLMKAELPECMQKNEYLINYAFANNLKTQILFPDDILETGDKFYKFARILNIDINSLYHDLKDFLEYNDEVLNTINPLIFKNGLYKKLPQRILKRIIQHPDIQEQLIQLDGNKLEIALQIIYDVNKKSNLIDDSVLLYNVLANIKLDVYDSLINSINPHSMSDEEVYTLTLILQDKNNFYGFRETDALSMSNYRAKKERIINEYKRNLDGVYLSLEETKSRVILAIFGLTLEEAKFLVERYCHDLNDMHKIGLPGTLEKYLIELKKAVENDSKKDLIKTLKVTAINISEEYNTFAVTEAKIRTYYAKKYKEELYQLKKDDELSNNGKNDKILNKIRRLSKNTKVYMPDDDFKMQVYAIGAYNEFETPENFNTYWNMPKVACHGLCTSLISNQQIATARQFHPIFGFSSYADTELLLSGNTDLKSKHANLEYNISHSLRKVSKFYTPDGLINNTRHSHNEVVIERKTNSNTKRFPNYVVLIIDNKNNEYNFLTKIEALRKLVNERKIDLKSANDIAKSKSSILITELVESKKISLDTANKIREAIIFEETVQASNDFHIPIVILDRYEIATKEKKRVNEDLDKFKQTLDTKALEDAFTRYFNNLVGCHHFKDLQSQKSYHTVFTLNDFRRIYNDIFEYILSFKDSPMKENLIRTLSDIVEKEIEKNRYELLKVDLRNYLEKQSIKLKELLRQIKVNGKPNPIDNIKMTFSGNVKELEDFIISNKPVSSENIESRSPFIYVKNDNTNEETIFIDKRKIKGKTPETVDEIYRVLIDDIKMIIFKSGRKIRLIDKTTEKVLFSNSDLKEYKKQFAGISKYSDEDYKVSDNLYFKGMQEFLPKIDENIQTVAKARNPVVNNIINVLKRNGYNASYGPSKYADVEIIEAGSTGRYTNLPDEDKNATWDFDFTIRTTPENFQRVKNIIAHQIRCEHRNRHCSTFKVRLDKVSVPGSNQKVDVDFAFMLNKDDYVSLDEGINSRLENIKKQSPEKYKEVVANIMFAKKFMKDIGIYKPARSLPEDKKDYSGLSGIGIEYWILQHGGSFLDAAHAFSRAAHDKTFYEFKKNYTIFGLGEMHSEHSRGRFEHMDFVKAYLRDKSYNIIKYKLDEFLYNYYNSDYMDSDYKGKTN